MTGRELIIYILENGLEDEPVIKDGIPIGYKSIDEVAVELNIGKSTVGTLAMLGKLDYIIFDGKIFIPGNYEAKGVEDFA